MTTSARQTRSAATAQREAATKSKRRRRAGFVVAAVALTAVGGGAAFSYWTTSGSGTGSAATGTVSAVTIKATSAAVTGLYPGGPAQAIAGSFDNGNPGQVYIHQVSVAISGITGGANDTNLPACTAADFTVVQPTVTNAQIASGTGVGSWTGASLAMKNSATDQGNCKNATVALAFTSN